MLAGTDDAGNNENKMNTVFIPQSTTRVLLQQQLLRDLCRLDVVSLRKDLSTSGRLKLTPNFHSFSCELFLACTAKQ